MMRWIVLGGLLTSLCVGCIGEKEKSAKCVANESVQCFCPDGASGVQTCQSNGVFEDCVCNRTDTSGGDTQPPEDTGGSEDTEVSSDTSAQDTTAQDTTAQDTTAQDTGCTETLCGDACVDLTTDADHCGACDNVCAGGARCDVGACACPAEMPHACYGVCQEQPCTVNLTFDSNNRYGNNTSEGADIGDVDGDGDLDVFVANAGINVVWINNGSGTFAASGQEFPDLPSVDVVLADLDGDDALDAFVCNGSDGVNRWMNDGDGVFTSEPVTIPEGYQAGNAAVGDLDGDDDIDVFIVGFNEHFMLQNESGFLVDSGQLLGASGVFSTGVELGDLDGDDDLDAFITNSNGANEVWLNAGDGTFSDSGQSLGSSSSDGVALADFDSDGDLDAYVTNGGTDEHDVLWLNTGTGTFVNSNQDFSGLFGRAVATGDLDGDTDLDVYVVRPRQDSVRLNDGNAKFTDSGLTLPDTAAYDGVLGDLDGDGDLDVFLIDHGNNTVVFNTP